MKASDIDGYDYYGNHDDYYIEYVLTSYLERLINKFKQEDYDMNIKWFKTKEGFRSDDLSFVMYYINKWLGSIVVNAAGSYSEDQKFNSFPS